MPLLSLLIVGELIFGLFAMHGPFSAQLAQAEDAAPAPVDITPASPTEIPAETPPDTTAPEQSTPQEPPASEESAPPPQEETQPPAEPTTPQGESSQPPTDQTSAPNEVAPTQEIIGDENIQENIPSSTLLNEASQGETPSSEQTPPTPEINPVPVPEFTPEEITTIDNNSSIVSTEINDQIIQKTQQEDEQLAQTTTPQETAALTLQFADEKVSDIEGSIQSDDFASTDFLIQRVTDQLDQTLNNIGTLSQDNTGLRQDLKDFSQKADTTLRSVQLVVPENLEQDFEIARGVFLNIEQVK